MSAAKRSRLLQLAALFLGLLLVCLLFAWWRSPIDPVAWQPDPNPGLSGPFTANALLDDASLLRPHKGIGPEDVLPANDGWVYTGYADGRIVRFRGPGAAASAEIFANTGGRPLGLAHDAGGNLIVADAAKGLLSISPDGRMRVLVDSYQGVKMRFVDDLDIASDGTIWFSDASQKFGIHENIYNFFEPSFTGRLFSYDPANDETRLHIDGLFFANGVALGPDEAYVLVNETGMSRIHRLWLKGEKRGERDIFVDQLPGLPDNISFNGGDKFWLALVNLRPEILDKLADKPLLRKLLAALPASALMPDGHYGMAIALDTDGNVVRNLQSADGRVYAITSVNEYNGSLYFGSLVMDALARMEIPE